MVRRARQLQADEGIGTAPYRPPAMRDGASRQEQVGASLDPMAIRLDTHDDPPVIGSRSLQGRARAGTLPSSWGNAGDDDIQQPHESRRLGISPIGGDIGTRPRSSQQSSQYKGLTGSVPGTPSDTGGGDFPSGGAFVPGNRGVGGTSRPMTLLRQLSAASELGRSASSASLQISALHPHPSSSTHDTSSPGAGGQSSFGDLRTRSGSVTAAMSSLGSNAFGPSIFTSTWSERPLAGGASSATDSSNSRRSSTLASASASSMGQDGKSPFSYEYKAENGGMLYEDNQLDGTQDVQTLDYLGLEHDDGTATNNVSRLSVGHAPQRNRASTLAAMPPGTASRHLGYADPANHHHPAAASAEANARLQDLYNAYTQQNQVGSSGLGTSQGRNRAGTVAALGGPGGRHRVERELLRMATTGNLSSLSDPEMGSLLASLNGLGLGSESKTSNFYNHAPLEGFPHLDVATPPTLSGRPSPFSTLPSTPTGQPTNRNLGSVDEIGYGMPSMASQNTVRQASAGGQAMNREPTSTNQTPSRSLWIGNLDSATTGQELMHAFAPYGAIESLRLLPEKECGFVNFVEAADAIRAREDVLGRLGAKLNSLGTGPGGSVRIGFGKIDSAPNQSSSRAGGMTETGHGQPHVHVDDPSSLASSAIAVTGSDVNTPTRALWVGSIPSSVTPATLLSVFQPFGPVESARVLTHKNCGFINFERVDDAVRARKMLNGREVLGSEVGAMRIGFAKVPTRNVDQYPADGGGDLDAAVDALSHLKGARTATLSTEQQIASGGLENYRSNLVVSLLNEQQQRSSPTLQQNQEGMHSQPMQQRAHSSTAQPRAVVTSSSNSIVPASDKGGVPLPAHMAPRVSATDLQLLMHELSQGDPDAEADVASVAELRPSMTYYMSIPLVSEVSSGRRFETAKLREIRRGIESGQFTTMQCDQLALEFIESIVDLASDYIGNTLVQKFFESCGDQLKVEMLHRLAPHLAMVGCHKNGTWAAQKILDCANSVEQVKLIGQNIRPYVPGLLLDSFGNYVVQCCLPWSNYNDFVFDAMVDRCWEIAQGRFGARSMRACLENGNVTKRQRKRVAIAIILNSVPLATSPNGSILLTWLLETSGLSKSYKLLAPRFTPHLTHLCTHKLASSTVLRLVTQKAEPEASQAILHALFEVHGHEQVLEEIIVDQVHGSQFITKILASPTLLHAQRDRYADQIRTLLEKHQLIGVPAYRRLCEDLGLVTPVLAPPIVPSQRTQPMPAVLGTPGAFAPFSSPGLTSDAPQVMPPVMMASAPFIAGMPPAPGTPPVQASQRGYGHPSSHAPLPQQPPVGAQMPQQDAFNPFWSSNTGPFPTGQLPHSKAPPSRRQP